MFSLVAFAASLAAASGAAQPPAGAPVPPPEFIQAAQGFGQCIEGGARQLPANVTPEAGAPQLLASCAKQKADLEAQFERWISGPSFPAEGRDTARGQFKAQIGQAETMVAGAIRQVRSGAAQSTPPKN